MNWDFFDRIYCITLRERPDRRREAEVQFEGANLSGLVEFAVREKDVADPERGIYLSHLACIEKGLSEGADTILVFEDDICFRGFDPQSLRNGVEFMKTAPDWHFLFLGCMVKASRRTDNPSVLKVRFRSLTHAYAVHRRFAEKIEPWSGIPYDDWLRDLEDDSTYALYPSFAFQSDSPSDNERYLPLDRFRRLLGGLGRPQRLDEFYHLRKTPVILSHVAAAAAFLAWLVS